MYREAKNNQVTIMGEVVSGYRFSHELYGEKFYSVDVRVKRLSESSDTIPVMLSDRLWNLNAGGIGMLVKVTGQFRSYNKCEDIKKKLLLSIFARDIEVVEEINHGAESNQIYLEGYICKEPVYRETPLGREIADVLLAVNRPYGKSDYIPCICWGRNARFISSLTVGTQCSIGGRVQSREYIKKISDNQTETRVAYEVSVSKMEVISNEK